MQRRLARIVFEYLVLLTWASQAQLQYATAIRYGHSSTSYHEVSKQGPESRSDLPLSPMHVGLCLCLEAVQLYQWKVMLAFLRSGVTMTVQPSNSRFQLPAGPVWVIRCKRSDAHVRMSVLDEFVSQPYVVASRIQAS